MFGTKRNSGGLWIYPQISFDKIHIASKLNWSIKLVLKHQSFLFEWYASVYKSQFLGPMGQLNWDRRTLSLSLQLTP